MNAKETLLQWLADGDLERALKGLLLIQKQRNTVSLEESGFDAFLQSSRFNTLKNSHSKGAVAQADYSVELARIRETVTAAIRSLPEDCWAEGLASLPPSDPAPVKNADLPRPSWKKWAAAAAAALGVLAAAAEFSGYSLRDFFQEEKPVEPVQQPVLKDTLPPAPIAQPQPAQGKNNVKIEVKDKAKVGNIITGDSNKIEVKQDF
jgi:hypothetical protein